MSNELDYELTANQWETLKALRAPAANPSRISKFAVERLIGDGLVAMRGESLTLTPAGRRVLIRGSSQLLQDLAA